MLGTADIPVVVKLLTASKNASVTEKCDPSTRYGTIPKIENTTHTIVVSIMASRLRISLLEGRRLISASPAPRHMPAPIRKALKLVS